MPTGEQYITILEEHVRHALEDVATFRQYLQSGPDTERVKEAYDGLRNDLATLFRAIIGEARKLDEQRGQLREELVEQRDADYREVERLEVRCTQLASRIH